MPTKLRSSTTVYFYLICFIVVILLSALFVLIGSSRAHAQQAGYSITMTPSSTELRASPGETTTSRFTVVNQGQTSYPLLLSTQPYHVVGDIYDPQFTILAGTTDASSWIQFDEERSQTLLAGKTKDVLYTLTVPTGTAPGGYYAVIFAETNPEISKNGVTPRNRVGNILYITVAGAVETKGSIEKPSSDIPSVIWGNSAAVGVLVKNTGGVHYLTKTHLNISSVFGRSLFNAELERYVLPQTQRLITANWEKLPAIGIYKVARDSTIAGSVQRLPDTYIVVIQPWIFAVIIIGIAYLVTLAVLRARQKQKNNVESPDVQD